MSSTTKTDGEILAGTAKLSAGHHQTPAEGVNVMELASVLAGQAFNDHPGSVDPVLAAFLRHLNDRLDDTDRQRLRPYAAAVVGTRCDLRTTRARAMMCARSVAARVNIDVGNTLFFAAVKLRRYGLRVPRFTLVPAAWGRLAAEFAVTVGGVDGALALCDSLIRAEHHRRDMFVPDFDAIPLPAL
jgi:hypothetical protein